jgi:hypothetical protein
MVQPTDDRHWSTRFRVLAPAAAFSATFAGVQGLSGAWARQVAAPRVILLGAGEQLSVLVTAGPARLLLAIGDDTTRFGNALQTALPITTRRIDVVLLAGSGRAAAVARHALRAIPGRRYYAIQPGLTPAMLEPPRGRAVEPVSDAIRFRLPEGIEVLVEAEPDAESTDRGWRMIISRGPDRIAVVASGKVRGALGPVSVLVLADGTLRTAAAGVEATALFFNGAAGSLDALRSEAGQGVPPDLLVLPVSAGETQALAFVSGGLRLPRSVRRLDRQPITRTTAP